MVKPHLLAIYSKLSSVLIIATNQLARKLCVCRKQLTVEHAMCCASGGFPSIWHNELCNLTVQFLTETCHRVGIEPPLQPLGGEVLRHRTANREDGAHLDIVAENFWGRDPFFDVRVFNPYAPSHRGTTLAQCYRRNEP